MAWHILKKDLRLLWVFAVTVGAVQCAAAVVRYWLDRFPESTQLATIADLLSLLSFLGMVILTVLAMHQDAVPGVRQDWLIRPIRRRDLVLAKLLFVLLIVQGPALLADLGGALGRGFAFPAAFEAALARNLAILCLLTLPAAMVGVVTRNVTEFLLVSMAGFVGYVAIFMVGLVLLLKIRTTLGGTGLVWMTPATWYVLALIGAPTVLALQFLQRRTTPVRLLVAAGGAVVLLSAFLPWRLAFALQEKLAPEPHAAQGIALAFDPQLGRFKVPEGSSAAPRPVLYLPLRVTGVPSSSVVLMDRAEVRIRDASGKPLYDGRTNLTVDGFGSIKDAQLEVRQRRGNEAPVEVYQRIFLPGTVIATVANRSVSLDIEYALTLYRIEATYSLPAAAGHGSLGRLGSCSTRIDGEGDDVQLRCVSTRSAPSCVTAFLEYTPTGLRNPEAHNCDPDYTPVRMSFWPDALSRTGGELPFFDRSGLTRYPIDGSKLAESRLIMETYEPRDHFTRRVTIPAVRISDFIGTVDAPAARP